MHPANHRTPQPLDASTLPRAVVSAELRRGTLVPCGPGVRAVGWPDCSSVRAVALRPYYPAQTLTAVLHTAAWVWGAPWESDARMHFSTLEGARFLRRVAPGTTVNEYRIAAEHVTSLNGVWVTTPGRTVYDLLFLPEHTFEDVHRNVLCFLVKNYALWHDDLVQKFHHRNRPHRKRASKRLAWVREQLGVSR